MDAPGKPHPLEMPLQSLICSRMGDSTSHHTEALGKGVYGATEALRLINFRRDRSETFGPVSRKTVGRWLRGYDYQVQGEARHSDPLWKSDYADGDEQDFEISFRDLIELRFVKAFRDIGLGLPTIRQCFLRAVEEVKDPRPFSTQKFRTDGRTIFLDITKGIKEGELIDLRRRQSVFRTIVAPSLKDLEFDADIVARWYPLGIDRQAVVVDPARSFGRPVLGGYGIPTETLAAAIKAEGSVENVARLYEVSSSLVREAQAFEMKLAA